MFDIFTDPVLAELIPTNSAALEAVSLILSIPALPIIFPLILPTLTFPAAIFIPQKLPAPENVPLVVAKLKLLILFP